MPGSGPCEDFTEKDLPVAPLLVVEVLSPSTAMVDTSLKKAAYQRMGVQSYWLVDPVKPSLTVFELDSTGFRYQRIAEVVGDKAFEPHSRSPYVSSRPNCWAARSSDVVDASRCQRNATEPALDAMRPAISVSLMASGVPLGKW